MLVEHKIRRSELLAAHRQTRRSMRLDMLAAAEITELELAGNCRNMWKVSTRTVPQAGDESSLVCLTRRAL